MVPEAVIPRANLLLPPGNIDNQGLTHSFTAELQPGTQAQGNSQSAEPVHTAPAQTLFPCRLGAAPG